MAHAALINRSLLGGLGLAIKFDAAALPFFNEWKMMGEGDYVVGVEPSNVPCENRASLRQKGRLATIAPGEVKEFRLEIGVLEGAGEIDSFSRNVARMVSPERAQL
jgi:hypothetical protein